jgi:hypothetical protein
MTNSTVLIIIPLAIFAGIVYLAHLVDRHEAVSEASHIRKLNRRFVEATVATITETLALHPDTPKTTRIVGANKKRPVDFGRIYSKTRDYIFPIHTPTQSSYDEYGTETRGTATDASLVISGTVGDYTVKLQDRYSKLTYSSVTDEITSE